MGFFSKSSSNNNADVPIATAVAVPVHSSNAAESLPPPTMGNDKNSKNQQYASATAPNYQQQQGNLKNNVVYDIGRTPVCMDCPVCGAKRVSTRTKTYPGWETWACGLGIALVFWPLCWVPLVLDNCKQTDHLCINCGEKVAEVKPMRDCCMEERG